MEEKLTKRSNQFEISVSNLRKEIGELREWTANTDEQQTKGLAAIKEWFADKVREIENRFELEVSGVEGKLKQMVKGTADKLAEENNRLKQVIHELQMKSEKEMEVTHQTFRIQLFNV